jgi:DNA-binding response OmpR family regulator
MYPMNILKNTMNMNKMPTILIVDDDQVICDLVAEILKEDGYSYEIALNAHDALDKIRNQTFDITLLDIKLPDRSGIDLLGAPQSLSQTTSIIMMTAVKDLDIAIRAMKLGASDYVVKPFTIEKLTTSITTVLRNREIHNSVFKESDKVEDINHGRRAIGQSLRTINSISIGVDAQVDYFDFHSTIVTEKTVELARRFGLPAKEIEKWEITRNKQYIKRMGYIKSMLCKLEQNPLAQVMLGLTNSVTKYKQAGMEQN